MHTYCTFLLINTCIITNTTVIKYPITCTYRSNQPFIYQQSTSTTKNQKSSNICKKLFSRSDSDAYANLNYKIIGIGKVELPTGAYLRGTEIKVRVFVKNEDQFFYYKSGTGMITKIYSKTANRNPTIGVLKVQFLAPFKILNKYFQDPDQFSLRHEVQDFVI